MNNDTKHVHDELVVALERIARECASDHAAIRTPGDLAAEIARAALAKVQS